MSAGVLSLKNDKYIWVRWAVSLSPWASRCWWSQPGRVRECGVETESASPFVPGELKCLLIWRWAADLQDVFSEWKLVIIVHAL